MLLETKRDSDTRDGVAPRADASVSKCHETLSQEFIDSPCI